MNLKRLFIMLFTLLLPVLLQANGENEKLIKAATDGDLPSLASALESGADAKNQALLEAVKSGNFEVVETLLTHGADPRVEDHAAIDYAIENKDRPMIKLLLKAIHARNSSQDLTSFDAKPSRRVDALLLADK